MSLDSYDSLIGAIAEKLAQPQPLVLEKVVSDRRGTTVLKLQNAESTGSTSYFALKFANLPSYAAEVIANEAEVLQELQEFTNHLYCYSGEFEGLRYVLTRWLGGEKVHAVASSIRLIPDDVERRRGWLELSLNLTRKLHELHKLGYLHYDIQPEHFRIINGKTHLFDFGLSCPNNKINVLYKGGLIHFQSIEVCNYVLQENNTIDYYIKSELYALAATLYFLYTEQTVIGYDFKLPLKEKLEIIATSEPRSFAEVVAEEFPEFEAVLQGCLHPDLDKRFGDLSIVIAELQKLSEHLG